MPPFDKPVHRTTTLCSGTPVHPAAASPNLFAKRVWRVVPWRTLLARDAPNIITDCVQKPSTAACCPDRALWASKRTAAAASAAAAWSAACACTAQSSTRQVPCLNAKKKAFASTKFIRGGSGKVFEQVGIQGSRQRTTSNNRPGNFRSRSLKSCCSARVWALQQRDAATCGSCGPRRYQ